MPFFQNGSSQISPKKRPSLGCLTTDWTHLRLWWRVEFQQRPGHEPHSPRPIQSQPTALAATAGNQQVSLTWTASNGATSYHVKRATATGGPYMQSGSVMATSYTDAGLTNGTKYFYVVSALNAAGESANSIEVSGTPAAPAPGSPVPAVPNAVAATAGNQQVNLTWTASSGATSYHVKRSTVSGGPYTQVGAPTSASYANTGLTNGTTYFYVVSALNATGESANSSQASATPAAAAADVTVTVDPTKTKPISPWIYGLNFYTGVSGAPPHLTLGPRRRQSLDRIQLGDQRLQRRQRLSLRKRQLSDLEHNSGGSGPRFRRRGSEPGHGECDDHPAARLGIGRRERAGQHLQPARPDPLQAGDRQKKHDHSRCVHRNARPPAMPTSTWTNFSGPWTRRSRASSPPMRRSPLS